MSLRIAARRYVVSPRDDVTPSGAHVGASRRQQNRLQNQFMSLRIAARRCVVKRLRAN
jgi:hypothetical protein